MKNKHLIIFIVLLSLLFGCNNRHASKKDKFIANAKLVFHKTIFNVLSGESSLVVSNSVEVQLSRFLQNDVSLNKSNAYTGTIIINPNIKSWQIPPHVSRSNEIAIAIQWRKNTNESEYYSVGFDGLRRSLSHIEYIDSINKFGEHNALIVIAN